VLMFPWLRTGQEVVKGKRKSLVDKQDLAAAEGRRPADRMWNMAAGVTAAVSRNAAPCTTPRLAGPGKLASDHE